VTHVLLINPSYGDTYRKVRAGVVNPIYPVLGLAAIAGEALRRGHDVRILDLSYDLYDWRRLEAILETDRPDVLGITATTPLANQLRDISILAKDVSPQTVVVAGGPHPSALPASTLRESMLDGVLTGEADMAFGDLCDGADLASLPGAWTRDGDQIVSNGTSGLVGSLDDLAFPAWHLYDPAEYKHRVSRLLARTPPAASVEFSRGCVFKCDYCASKNTMGLGYRKKSPTRCAEEVLRVHRLGWGEFALTDDIFTSDNKWAARVCEAIVRAGAPLPWTCTNGIRVESADSGLFELMFRAGCYRVSFGMESGRDDVLMAFGKGGKASIEQGREAAKMARRAGIETNGYFMLGLSADDEETLEDTIRYAASLELDMISFGITVPFPGTPMFQVASREGRVRSWDWDRYNAYEQAELFTHPKLSRQQVLGAMNRAYRKALLGNPSFVLRRFGRSLRTGELLQDLRYLAKFVGRPAYREGPVGIQYYARDRWPTRDFEHELPEETDYPRARRAV